MTTFSTLRPALVRRFSLVRMVSPLSAAWFGLGLCLLVTAGCQGQIHLVDHSLPKRAAEPTETVSASDEFTLQSGDTVKISFPSVPNLDTTQQIRSDGRLNLPMIGEIVASGKTTSGLETDLISQYSSKIVSKEVSVTIVSAPFYVFVSGAVLKPGKVITDHPISALEAVMEAGGFDNGKANMAKVIVVRQDGKSTKSYTIDLKQVLEGKKGETFYLRRSDIVQVPDKFNWF